MTLKATWCWNGFAKGGNLAYGFSETWYSDDQPALLIPKMEAIARLRTTIMARNCSYYGSRIADVSPGARAYTQRSSSVIKSLARAGFPNIPQDAVLCQCLGLVPGTVKRFWFHNLPDEAVVDADFSDGQPTVEQSRLIINRLASEGFKFRYQVQNTPAADIQGIDANGVVTTVQPLAEAVQGAYVQLYHVRGVDGRGKRGKYRVASATDNRHFTLAHWPGDIVNLSGRIRIVTYAFTGIQVVPADGIGSDPCLRPGARKCGRLFGLVRGREVARR